MEFCKSVQREDPADGKGHADPGDITVLSDAAFAFSRRPRRCRTFLKKAAKIEAGLQEARDRLCRRGDPQGPGEEIAQAEDARPECANDIDAAVAPHRPGSARSMGMRWWKKP